MTDYNNQENQPETGTAPAIPEKTVPRSDKQSLNEDTQKEIFIPVNENHSFIKEISKQLVPSQPETTITQAEKETQSTPQPASPKPEPEPQRNQHTSPISHTAL